MAQIAVVGTGYVGLTTGACLALLGHDVVCVDINESKITMLKQGTVEIVEDQLQDITRDMMFKQRLRFQFGYDSTLSECEYFFICVPTPQNEDGTADLSFLRTAATSLKPLVRSGAVLINKSTVPVGSTTVVEEIIDREDIHVVSNPEFLREGSAVQDFLNPDRIVVGSKNRQVAERVLSLFESLNSTHLICSPESSETIKYASNAFLATKLTYVNAIAALCEHVGANVDDVIRGVGLDRRIGLEYMNPGPGWGGSCFPKDTQALIRIAEASGYDFPLLRGVVELNDSQFSRMVDKIASMLLGELENKVVALLGLTFKANTNDLRESPSIRIASILKHRGAIVHAYDPTVSEQMPDIRIFTDAYECCSNAQILVICTEWNEFLHLDIEKVGLLMEQKNVLDTRNMLNPETWIESGFTYRGVGR